MSEKPPPAPRQQPNSKGVTRSNDQLNNLNEQGQPGNIHQNTMHARTRQDR